MASLQTDPVPRLLLTVLADQRCRGCGRATVRGFATPGLEPHLGGADVSKPVCMNRRCLRALGAAGLLRALETALAAL
jgi:hypothetical protein